MSGTSPSVQLRRSGGLDWSREGEGRRAGRAHADRLHGPPRAPHR
jgi:hypothetical protein